MRTIAGYLTAFALLSLGISAHSEQAVRLKDIAKIEGERSNQLLGYGLVIGLDGTGDTQQSTFTPQSVANMLQKFGVSVPASKMKVKNVAAVIVTADLPPYVHPGTKIDVLISSLGDAKSLQGGTLLQTPLQAANGNVYAVAQGAISVGGFTAGGGGASVTKNHTTVARMPGGAIVEQGVTMSLTDGKSINVLLNDPDFATASRVAHAIEERLGQGSATALDPATVKVTASNPSDIVGLVAEIGDLMVSQSTIAKVIVNERTGTVVIGSEVTISPVAVSHGDLSVEISADAQVSQPAPASGGKTAVTTDTSVKTTETRPHLMELKSGATLEDLIRALNELKVTPRDMIAILQALKQAGALHAELEVI